MNKGGPRTAEGKAVVATNAVTHGALSSVPVLRGLEEPSVWEAHRAGTLESLAPVGHLETVLAERCALLLWRLGRVARYESEAIAILQEEATETKASLYLDGERTDLTLPEAREQASALRTKVRRLRAVPSWPDERILPTDTAADVIYAVEEAADLTDRQRDAFSYPGVPDGAGIEDLYDWSAADVRACLAALSACCGKPLSQLLAAATAHANRECIGMDVRVEILGKQIERRRRQWMLPRTDDLQKLTRYEAHLHRQSRARSTNWRPCKHGGMARRRPWPG